MTVRTVLSLEQATALPYATLRFVHLGWRVIRIEATGPTGTRVGDPNRYVGDKIADDQRRSVFVAPNVGKESIALNLKAARGRAALLRLVKALNVDVFCCNTLPRRYAELGIDYETLCAAKPDLIWAGISALGPEFPDFAGYDPIVQAMSGITMLNGAADGPPTLVGVPVSDLKAGDEVYAGVLAALLNRAETGRGARIDVSMLQATMSWLIASLPLMDMGATEQQLMRSGNAHRRFVPTNVYPTQDGFVFIAIGNDAQWQRLVALPAFETLREPRFGDAPGRYAHREDLYKLVTAATQRVAHQTLVDAMAANGIPHAPISTLGEARAHPAIASRLTRTTAPDGKSIRMQPPAIDLHDTDGSYTFPPLYGEQTRAVLLEGGFSADDIDAMAAEGVIAEASP